MSEISVEEAYERRNALVRGVAEGILDVVLALDHPYDIDWELYWRASEMERTEQLPEFITAFDVYYGFTKFWYAGETHDDGF